MEQVTKMLMDTLTEKQNCSMFVSYLSVRLRMIDEMHQAFYYPEEQRNKNVSKLLKQTILVVDEFYQNREKYLADEDFDPTKIVPDAPMDRIAYVILNVSDRKSFVRIEYEKIGEFINEIHKFRMIGERVDIEIETLGGNLSEEEIKVLEENNIFIKPNKDV